VRRLGRWERPRAWPIDVPPGRRLLSARVLLDVNDVALGHVTEMRWNDNARWIVSDQAAHPPVIDDATFHQVRDVLAGRGRGPGQHKAHAVRRTYEKAGDRPATR
jgi:hypothetical protein